MSNPTSFMRRNDASAPAGLSKTVSALLIAGLCFLIATVLLVGSLLYLRRRRLRCQAQELPLYTEKCSPLSSSRSGSRGLFTRFTEPLHVYQEKQALMKEVTIIPNGALPEIRITLPEEYDASGKRQSGRVVVLHIGDHGEAISPLDETLPAYQEKDSDRFQSLDLNRIGGLIEQARNTPRQA